MTAVVVLSVDDAGAERVDVIVPAPQLEQQAADLAPKFGGFFLGDFLDNPNFEVNDHE